MLTTTHINHCLLNKNFLLLLQGQLISLAGQYIYMTAMLFWLKHVTNSATVVGLFTFITFLPGAILGPFGGAISDRYSRKKIIIIGDIVNACSLFFLAFVFLFISKEKNFLITCLFVVAIVIGIVNAFFSPAVNASIPDLVLPRDIQRANSLFMGSLQTGIIVGRLLGGVLFVVLGMPILMLLNAVAYLFSAFSEAFIVMPERSAVKSQNWLDDFREFRTDISAAFRYICDHPGLKYLFFATAARVFCLGPLWGLMPFFVEDTMKSTPGWYGLLMAGSGLGVIAGCALAAVIKVKPANNGKLFLAMFFLFGLKLIVLGYSSTMPVAMIGMIMLGVSAGFIGVLTNSALQIAVPSEMRGRLFGLMTTLSVGLLPISMGVSGVMADLMNRNLSFMYSILGLCVLVTGGFLASKKGFHQVLSYQLQ